MQCLTCKWFRPPHLEEFQYFCCFNLFLPFYRKSLATCCSISNMSLERKTLVKVWILIEKIMHLRTKTLALRVNVLCLHLAATFHILDRTSVNILLWYSVESPTHTPRYLTSSLLTLMPSMKKGFVICGAYATVLDIQVQPSKLSTLLNELNHFWNHITVF